MREEERGSRGGKEMEKREIRRGMKRRVGGRGGGGERGGRG